MKPTPRPLEAILDEIVGPIGIPEQRQGVTPQMGNLLDDQLARLAQRFSPRGGFFRRLQFYTAKTRIFREFGEAALH